MTEDNLSPFNIDDLLNKEFYKNKNLSTEPDKDASNIPKRKKQSLRVSFKESESDTDRNNGSKALNEHQIKVLSDDHLVQLVKKYVQDEIIGKSIKKLSM